MPKGPTVIAQPPPGLPLCAFAPPLGKRGLRSRPRRAKPPGRRPRWPRRPSSVGFALLARAFGRAARRRSRPRIRAARGEESREQLTAFVGENAALGRRVVVEARLGKEVDDRAARPGLRVARAVDEPRDPRMQDR